MAKRTAPRAWNTSSRIGPIYGRRVCAPDRQRAGKLDRLTISIWGLDTVGRPRITGDAWAARHLACAGNGPLGTGVAAWAIRENRGLRRACCPRAGDPPSGARGRAGQGRVRRGGWPGAAKGDRLPRCRAGYFDLSRSPDPVREARERRHLFNARQCLSPANCSNLCYFGQGQMNFIYMCAATT